jgi:hypothetical protein
LRNLLAALLAATALTVVGTASADPMRYGAADDWPKFHPCGDIWWTSADDIGYRDLRMTIQWDAAAPTVIPYEDNITAALDCAALSGVRPILSIFPSKPSAIGSNGAAQAQFAAFVALAGEAFPGVDDFIVGNEPNVNRFWQPQYASGKDAAASDYEHTLAQSYDALKAVRPDSTVWGPAISSRGNDNAHASSNPSHSPVWFIKDLGDAYKASGRSAPIFDVFDMHPYPPAQDTDRFSKKFQWPQAGAANLDRIKQALWDAFHGTSQADAEGGLRFALDEAGEQTVLTGHEPAYDGTPENVAPIGEPQQAAAHVELAEIGACDPSVETVLWFPLIDDRGISTGFQSGNLFADDAHKQSYDAMKAKIASAQGSCQGGVAGIPTRWAHTRQVVGAQPIFGGPGAGTGSQPASRRFGVTGVWTSLIVGEDASYTARLTKVAEPRGGPGKTIATRTGLAKASHRPGVNFTAPKPFAAGYYRFTIVLRAATNPARTTTLVSRTFEIGGSVPDAKPRATGQAGPKPAKKAQPASTIKRTK